VIRLDQPRGFLIMNMPPQSHCDPDTRELLAERACGDPGEAGRSKPIGDLEQQAAASIYQRVPAQASPSLCDGLAQLNSLHDRGALSDGEFAVARAKLLGLTETPQAGRRP
jgi:hypothetical protein